MNPAQLRRPRWIWSLCLLALFGLQSCALQHGHTAGLMLSGLLGSHCSADPSGWAPFPVEPGAADGHWTCPLCQAATSEQQWPLDLPRGSKTPALRARRRVRPVPRRLMLAWPRAP